MKNLDSKNSPITRLATAVFVLLVPVLALAQDIKTAGYRNIKAYSDDFAKNEMYIKKSLIEYSEGLIENHENTRVKATAARIVVKLKNINNILGKYDQGFEKNTILRDGFISMNQKTIECLTNGTLILNDYEKQAKYDVSTIEKNLAEREAALISYFEALRNYDDAKLDFGVAFNITPTNIIYDNLFEYNGYQNILLYKMNVIDQKMTASINQVDIEGFKQAIAAAEKVYLEVMEKTDHYKNDYHDQSLNDATIAYANFLKNQNNSIAMLFENFAREYQIIQEWKGQQVAPEYTQQYNEAINLFNFKKNLLFDSLARLQYSKKQLLSDWYKTNRNFLKYNSKFEDIHENSITYAEKS